MSNSKISDRHISDVEALFNAKAETWDTKYAPYGALKFRIDAFQKILRSVVPANAKILDFGCGTGAISSALTRAEYRLTACDFAERMIATGRRIYADQDIEWQLLSSDWTKLPFETNAFDAVVASSVLEYVSQLSEVLRECQRVTRPGGILIASVPNTQSLTRRIEKMLRIAAPMMARVSAIRFPKLHSYAVYLQRSSNRLPFKQWAQIGSQSGFSRVERDTSQARHSDLDFLLFRRAPQG